MDILGTKWWSWSILQWMNGCIPCSNNRQRWRFICYFMGNIAPKTYEFIPYMYNSSMGQRCPPTPYIAFWRTYFSVCGLPCQREAAMLNPTMYSPNPGEIWYDYDRRNRTRYPFVSMDQYEDSIFMSN